MDAEIYSSYSTLQSVFKRVELDVANGFCHPSKNGVDVPLMSSLFSTLIVGTWTPVPVQTFANNPSKITWKSGNVKPELGIESWGGESLEAERSKGSG